MDDPFADLARESSDAQLLHMLQDAPEDWSPEALEAARAELRSRGIGWEEKPEEPPRSTSWLWKIVYLTLGLVAGVVLLFLVFVVGLNPRWVIGVAAVMGLIGYTVPRRFGR